jgi:hypothetical protein
MRPGGETCSAAACMTTGGRRQSSIPAPDAVAVQDRLTEEQIAATADPRRARQAGLPTVRDGVKAGAWLCGPPERIIEQLKALEERYPGLEQINVGQPVGTPERVILEQLAWFARAVMPAFG